MRRTWYDVLKPGKLRPGEIAKRYVASQPQKAFKLRFNWLLILHEALGGRILPVDSNGVKVSDDGVEVGVEACVREVKVYMIYMILRINKISCVS